jgi:SAM-dependent methyltransferase
MTIPGRSTPSDAELAWAEALAAWRIPDHILGAAPQSPWIHPVELFRASDEPPTDSPSHHRAREALPPAGSVLDVGCGGGRAAFAVAPPAVHVTGVDHQAGMLEAFARGAEQRGLGHQEVLGDWPEVADDTPSADVVVCHHVAYNVADLATFVTALDGHARRRVVLELPQRHPLAAMAPLWHHFWNLDRPHGPTATDALAVVRAAGFDARLEQWQPEIDSASGLEIPFERRVEFMRIRLCLTPDHDAELADVMHRHPAGPRELATMWWDSRG